MLGHYAVQHFKRSGGWLHARIQVQIHYYTFNMRICTIVFNMAIMCSTTCGRAILLKVPLSCT